MRAYELNEHQLEGHHDLCDLLKEAGYPVSLRNFLNTFYLWGEDVEDIENTLRQEIKEN
ncbi:MAG: hypothetical protein H8E05_00195 [Bacteroidetes bacterium]|nr:hypothetical protein [Bacteroidota bacterium]